MINKPPIKNDENNAETNETIQKMMKIWDILLVNSPHNKKFNKKNTSYISDLFFIVSKLENDKSNYSDDEIKRDINNLYDKIFKRRH